MVVGKGLLGRKFSEHLDELEEVLVFASGVSNSHEVRIEKFEREKKLLEQSIQENPSKLIVYFSSCALKETPMTPYYRHKQKMEEVVKRLSANYSIFRLPQVIGESSNRNTLINYLYDMIESDKEFNLLSGAFRYVIDINDIYELVVHIIHKQKYKNRTIDLANNYRYSVFEIVETLEGILQKKARYNVIDKNDEYELNLDLLKEICRNDHLDFQFGKEYLHKKILEQVEKYDR